MTQSLDLQKPAKKIYLIVIIGILFGISDHLLMSSHLIYSIIFHVFTAFMVGFSLLMIAFNKHIFFPGMNGFLRYIFLSITFLLIGTTATELEIIFRSLLLSQFYIPLTAGKIYLLNSIISVSLGFAFYFKTDQEESAVSSDVTIPTPARSPEKIPIKRGHETILKDVAEVVYFEALDNYSFLYDQQGEKHLCDYSLGYLDTLLNPEFIRVHRKYIVNKDKIESVAKHLKDRYVIRLKDRPKTSLISSSSYATPIRSLIKL